MHRSCDLSIPELTSSAPERVHWSQDTGEIPNEVWAQYAFEPEPLPYVDPLINNLVPWQYPSNVYLPPPTHDFFYLAHQGNDATIQSQGAPPDRSPSIYTAAPHTPLMASIAVPQFPHYQNSDNLVQPFSLFPNASSPPIIQDIPEKDLKNRQSSSEKPRGRLKKRGRKPIEVDEEERGQRLGKHRERNKVAVKKFRQKRKQETTELAERVQTLEERRQELQQTVENLTSVMRNLTADIV